jgi:hypothetical protein
MTSVIFIPAFKTFLKIGQYFKVSNLEIDTSNKLKPTDSKVLIRFNKIGTILHYLYVTAMLLLLGIGHLSIQRKLQGACFFALYAYFAGLRPSYFQDDEPIQVVNAFLNFENQLYTRKKTLKS